MRLSFERLERRDLLTVLRFASWNTANNPDDIAEDADFETILDAIGNESVQGNATRIDLLALQEIDVPGAGMDSIGRIESILEGLYAGVDYDAAVSTLDGGGDATGFVYDTTTLGLLGTQEFSTGLTHTTLRGEFRPVGTTGEADFFVYSTHLKAGTTSGDENTRASEAALLRADADTLGIGTQIILAGDLNLQSSSEPGYGILLAADGAAELTDPIDTPGDWNNNNTFRSVHTQNPGDPSLGGGGMDDRFDFQLMTHELTDGLGIDYVPGSYRAFGNNGTHMLNQSITTGTGADPAVLAALSRASDHLPVVADYQILATVPGVTITESSGDTKVIEGGAIDAYTVTLSSVPQSDVTVMVTPDIQTDLGSGPGSSVSLVFTPDNAFTGQTVVVAANDDAFPEGNHTSVITHSSSSMDSAFDGLPVSDVIAKVLDNEAPTMVINELDSDTESIDMLEFVELYDGGVGNASLSGMTVVFYNGNNDESYAAFDLDGFSTDADGFFLLGNAALNPDVTFNNNFLQNGADAVALYAADGSDFPNGTAVTTADLLDAVVYDTDDADDLGLLQLLLPNEPQVNEDQNGNRVFESISRVPDAGTPRETTSYLAQAPTPRDLNDAPTPRVDVTQSAGRTDVEEGGATDSYTLALATFPTEDVTITVTPDLQVDLGLGGGVAIDLTFTPTNAVIPQTVEVTAVDDMAIEGPHAAVISHSVASVDQGYNGLPIGNVIANITDNETIPQTEVVISEIMYNPDSDETQPGVAEWIEIVNQSNVTVSLDGWTIDDEDSTDWGAIPANTTLDVDQVAVLFDADFATEAQFRSSWAVPASALVIGVEWGSLANSPSDTNEIVQLVDNNGHVQDEVNFDDSGDWPTDSPDGPSIYLLDLRSDNNDGHNWSRSTVGVDDARSPSAPFSVEDVGSPGTAPISIPVDGDFDNDLDYDCDDINALVAEIATGGLNLDFDLNGDGMVTDADLDAWLIEAGEAKLGPGRAYLRGDANLDGIVDGLDFILWNDNKFTSVAAWCSGDFNADGLVDGQDFIEWNTNKFQSSDAFVPFVTYRSASAHPAGGLDDSDGDVVTAPFATPVPHVVEMIFAKSSRGYDLRLPDGSISDKAPLPLLQTLSPNSWMNEPSYPVG